MIARRKTSSAFAQTFSDNRCPHLLITTRLILTYNLIGQMIVKSNILYLRWYKSPNDCSSHTFRTQDLESDSRHPHEKRQRIELKDKEYHANHQLVSQMIDSNLDASDVTLKLNLLIGVNYKFGCSGKSFKVWT